MDFRHRKQKEAVSAWLEYKPGTIVMEMGTGKSKCGIDIIKATKTFHILIISPRTNLKASWKKELEKWQIYHVADNEFDIQAGRRISIEFENIQTAYKWQEGKIKEFDLIIADEIHTMMTEKYITPVVIAKRLDIPVLGLTGTPELHKEEKKDLYDKYCPIVYEYYDSANDNLINKTKVYVLNYYLTNEFKTTIGTKKKSWDTGELDAYNYLERVLTESTTTIKNHLFAYIVSKVEDSIKRLPEHKEFLEGLISKDLDCFKEEFWGPKNEGKTLPTDLYFELIHNVYNYKKDYTKLGMKAEYSAKLAPADIKPTIYKYIWARNSRKKLLQTLTSSRQLALQVKEYILKNNNNKVLLFSELNESADVLSNYPYHSKISKAKKEELIEMFNKGEIRELSSCKALTLGLNLKGATHAIAESYNSSETAARQNAGRLNRLGVDHLAHFIIICPVFTQAEVWKNSMINGLKYESLQEIDSLGQLKEILK